MMARSREAHKPLTRSTDRTSGSPDAPWASDGGAGRLVVLSGPDRGRQLRLDRSVLTVGRNPTCDLVLTDRRVSGRHARLEVGAAGVVVIDRHSTNGTWRAGQRVSDPVELRPGEVVTFGEVDVRYELADADRSGAGHPAGGEDPEVAGPPVGEPPGAPADRPSAPPPATDDGRRGGSAPTAPTNRPRTVLISYDPVDRPIADRLVEVLQRAGHLVWIDRSTSGDGWGGRLLDTVWSCDAVVFVVSPAAAHCERVHREVHLAGSEHTPVLPVVAAPVELPPELAFYLERRRPIELWTDGAAGLHQLVDEVSALPRKRVARPRRLFAWLVALAVVVVLVVAALRYLLG